jgi:thioredoxin-related protein
VLIKVLIFCLFLFVNLKADYKDGEVIFKNKCSSCHSDFVSVNTIKENFFEKNNKLLKLKAPTVNMLAYAIMDSPKKIGDPNDEDMRQIEIENYLKSYLEKPDKFNSICDEHILKFYETKKAILDLKNEDHTNLAIFFMEYKNNLAKNIEEKELVQNDETSILKKAQKDNKKIIVYATSKTCFYCKKMDKEVLNLADIKKKIDENYVYIKIDVDETKLPFELQKVYKEITPTFFLVSKEGTYIKQYPGSWTKSDFIEILKENIKE